MWVRVAESEPGGCVETPAHTVVTSKSRPHPVWTPTPTLAQSSRGDHRALPAGIFVINGSWPRQPGYNDRDVVRDHLRDARERKSRLQTRVNAYEHRVSTLPVFEIVFRIRAACRVTSLSTRL